MMRFIELILAISLLILIFPLLIVMAILIRTKLGAPVLFTQLRPGLHGKPFKMYKFRTMLDAYDVKGEALPDALRLTSFGSMLRKSSIDELPELINIIRGDMGFVGPRPLLMEYLPLYDNEQKRRHDVRPGITGWAQINGRNSISWVEKFQLDIWYVDNKSFLLDIKIILLTVKKVFTQQDINADGHVTIERFTGKK